MTILLLFPKHLKKRNEGKEDIVQYYRACTIGRNLRTLQTDRPGTDKLTKDRNNQIDTDKDTNMDRIKSTLTYVAYSRTDAVKA